MDDQSDDGLLKAWTEYWGRHDQVLPPEFPEQEIVIGPYPLTVNLFGAGYTPSFPKLAAIIVSADGERRLSQGGYTKLPPGNYKIYYVDCHERYTNLSEVRGITSDGANAALTIGITYHTNDPIAVHNVRNPLDALFKGCEAALRNLIRTHKHDEIFGEPNAPGLMPDNEIAAAVKEQVGQNEACQAFSLLNVNVIDRKGHARLLNIREERVVQQQASERQIESTVQQTKLAAEQKNLNAMQGEITEQRALIERNRQLILQTVRKMELDLERLRKLPQYQHEQILKDFETRSKALEALIQALAMPGFPRNDQDRHFVDKILEGLPNISSLIGQENAPRQGSTTDEIESDDLIHLMIPKKRNQDK